MRGTGLICLGLAAFFFQAEDGIRDKLVTGVQTCALPILSRADTGSSPRGGHGSRRRACGPRRDPGAPLKEPLPMHLAQRAYVLVLLTAVLCVVGIWSEEPALAYLWHIPAALLLLGLALEGWFIARLPLEAQLSSAPRAFLGRPQPATFQFANA